jgi:AraC-like DNA-binding protein
VSFALARFHARPGRASVGAVQRASGASAERFIERFRDAVGLGPKRYLRVTRLRSLLERVAARGSANWSDLAFEFGFSDQAHLVREFRDLTGLTPGAYRPLEARQPMHVALGLPAEKPSRRALRAGLRSG